MSPRRLVLISSSCTLAVLAAMIFSIALWQKLNPQLRGGNRLFGHDDYADKLDLYDSESMFRAGELKQTAVDHAAVVLNPTESSFLRRGEWLGPVRQTEFAFLELIPSYNALVPPNTGVRLQVRVRDAEKRDWSPWLYLGKWGRTVPMSREDRENTSFAGGRVMIDTVMLYRPADAYQVRVVLQAFGGASTPTLRRVGVVYSGPVSDPAQRERIDSPPPYTGRWDRTLPVPFIPQGDAPKEIVGETCSPTSVTMALNYAGAKRSLEENCMAIFDEEHDIYGNWNRAVQRAGELGLDAWITRFRDWDQVKAMIATGQPVIASIRFKKGAMPHNPIYQDTDGHLIVIIGFTPQGDVVVNDPASREKGAGVVYKSQELANAWFHAGGVAYIIRPVTSRDTSSAQAESGRS